MTTDDSDALGENRPLIKVLSAALRTADIRVLDYEDPTTFFDLWLQGLNSATCTIAGENIDWDDDRATLIVCSGNLEPIFGNAPEWLMALNVKAHLTALSWAAAWRLCFPAASGRIVVFDPFNAAVGAARALLPLLAPSRAGQSAVPGLTYLASPNLPEILAAAARPKSATVAFAVDPLLRAILWNELTSQREGHHAISNIFGALSFRRDCGRTDFRASTVELALEQLICVVSHKAPNDEADEVWEPPHRGGGSFALIDDLADLWTPFLRSALGLAEGQLLTIRSHAFAETIVDLPSALLARLSHDENRLRASDLIPGWPAETDFVLFLDLRLFAGAAESVRAAEAQRTFISRLAEFGLALVASNRRLPWLSAAGRAALRDELSPLSLRWGGVNPSAGRVPSATLLPRLVSLMDPTLPIVIFSSTQRSDLIAPFQNYGNIVTHFRKPTVSGLAEDWSATRRDIRADFDSALARAMQILECRRLLRLLSGPAAGGAS